jgi:hypothetical protein
MQDIERRQTTSARAKGTMEGFFRNVAQGFVATLRQIVYLYLFGFVINYVLFTLFGINIWTFVLAQVAISILWVIKLIK